MKKSLTIALMIGLSEWAGASVIFSTDFESAIQPGAVGTAVTANGTVASGYTVSTFTQGAGYPGMLRLITNSTVSYFLCVPAGANPGVGAVQTLADAVANNEYFEFSVTAPTEVDFTGIKFSYVGTGSAQTGGITLRSSADSYTANLGTATGVMTSKYPVAVNLSAVSGFTDLSTVTFRLYFYDNYVGSQNRYIGIDDIEVSAIPEPATIGMLGLGALITILLRRMHTC
jgi:hypothetical protein